MNKTNDFNINLADTFLLVSASYLYTLFFEPDSTNTFIIFKYPMFLCSRGGLAPIPTILFNKSYKNRNIQPQSLKASSL